MANVTIPVVNLNCKLSKMTVSASVVPTSDSSKTLGESNFRFSDLYAAQTTIGAFFESGLKTEKIGENPTGTIVVWRDGKLIPSDKDSDEMVMGVIKNGKDEPIIFGAEYVLVTGEINEGDYIITSKLPGHGRGVTRSGLFKKDLFGKVIAQSLECFQGESGIVKAMIRKM